MRYTHPAGQSRSKAIVGAMAVLAVVAGVSCSSGDTGGESADAFESGRTRPTDQSEHDHSGESSALAPETVLPGDVAELGAGVAEGETMDLWVGVNICGRFVELPISRVGADAAVGGGLSIDGSGLLTAAPGPGDPTGHALTAQAVAESLDLDLSTGQLEFGASWEGQSIGSGDSSVDLGGASFSTGDECGLGPEPEQAEVQLWYYTPLAVVSGEQVRMVVTDPETTPLVEGGSALTIAFAPVSSLPTLPPAALLG